MSRGTTFNGLVVAVAGAGGTVGKAAATALAERGATVVLGDIEYDRAERLASAINHTITPEGGGVAIALALDAREPESFRRFLEEARNDFGALQVLVTCLREGLATGVGLAAPEMARRGDGQVVAVGGDGVTEAIGSLRDEFGSPAVVLTAIDVRREPPVPPERVASAVVAAVHRRPETVRVPRRGPARNGRLPMRLPAGLGGD